jgi:starch-binding outer membrane protein, SusD/RagB family
MKTSIKYIINRCFLLLIISGLVASCKKEYVNPSSASIPTVTTNVDALMNLAAGLQNRFTIGRQSPLYCAVTGGAYSVFAIKTIVSSNVAEFEMEIGKGSVSQGNSIVSQLWTQSMLTRTEAETILDNLNVANDPADKVGLKAYASIFYALSMGTLSQFFEKIPLVKENNATFSSRIVALEKVISILESADSDLSTTTPSSKFLSKVPTGIDVKNSIKALLARYYNIHSMATGTYNSVSGNKAIAFASAASQTIKSEFRFSVGTPNPVGNINFLGTVYGAVDSTLGLKNGLAPSPAITDPRVGYYISKVGANYPFKAFALGQTSSYPVYLPGEMTLIIAENQARQGSFVPAKNTLDAVRTKTTDSYLIGANQLPYSGALTTTDLLTDIYKQRRLELYLCGQELEDSRRFNRPAPNAVGEERNRNFYPYPLIERNNNTNTPADPTI